MITNIKKQVDFLKGALKNITCAETAFVLGSGLGYLSDVLKNKEEIYTKDIPNYPQSTVVGHKGSIITGELYDKTVIIVSGRVHLYEGYSYDEVVNYVRLLSAIGVKNLILTNAAGGIGENLEVGDIVLVDGYVNMMLGKIPNATNGETINGGLSKFLINKLSKAFEDTKIEEKRGVYASMTGPNFETPAEIKMLEKLGASVVGMSTVPEIIESEKLNVDVGVLSCVTNYAAGISETKLSHEEVFSAASLIKEKLTDLLKCFIKE